MSDETKNTDQTETNDPEGAGADNGLMAMVSDLKTIANMAAAMAGAGDGAARGRLNAALHGAIWAAFHRMSGVILSKELVVHAAVLNFTKADGDDDQAVDPDGLTAVASPFIDALQEDIRRHARALVGENHERIECGTDGDDFETAVTGVTILLFNIIGHIGAKTAAEGYSRTMEKRGLDKLRAALENGEPEIEDDDPLTVTKHTSMGPSVADGEPDGELGQFDSTDI